MLSNEWILNNKISGIKLAFSLYAASLGVCCDHWLVHGRGSFGLFSHDVRPSLNCRTHERTFFTSITPSLQVSLNCWWILMGFMPGKWRNRIITCCSSNVNVAIEVSKTLLSLDDISSIQRVGQCCHLASSNLKNSHAISNNFHVSNCFHSWEKILGELRTWMLYVYRPILDTWFMPFIWPCSRSVTLPTT